jgi:hypothetical protein
MTNPERFAIVLVHSHFLVKFSSLGLNFSFVLSQFLLLTCFSFGLLVYCQGGHIMVELQEAYERQFFVGSGRDAGPDHKPQE